MLFLQLGSNSNGLSVILEKPILSFQFTPPAVSGGQLVVDWALVMKTLPFLYIDQFFRFFRNNADDDDDDTP